MSTIIPASVPSVVVPLHRLLPHDAGIAIMEFAIKHWVGCALEITEEGGAPKEYVWISAADSIGDDQFVKEFVPLANWYLKHVGISYVVEIAE